MATHEQDRGCSCSEYEYALGKTLSLEKVFAIRRRGSEEVEKLCLGIHQAHILACTKQVTEVLKHAGVRDREALRSIMDSCSTECSFDQLHGKLEAYKISSAPSSTSLPMAVYEIVEVPADAAVSRPDPMHWDGEIEMEDIMEEWIEKENTTWPKKMYRVVCSHDCEMPSNVVYGSKQEAYAAAMLKQAAVVRNVSQQGDCISMEERKDSRHILEGMKGKPLEERHRDLLKRLKHSDLNMFHVEELFISSSFAGIADDATAAAAAMLYRGACLLRNSEETIYLVKSSPSRFGRSRWAAHEAFPCKDVSKITVLHGAFRKSPEAYSLAVVMQVRDVLQHARHPHLAHKESIRSKLPRLAAAAREEPREQVFASLKSWLMDEMLHLKGCRSFTVQKFVVKSFFEKEDGVFWEEIKERFDEWEEQLKAEGDSP